MMQAHLVEIRVHPIKSLDAVVVAESRIGPAGGLEFDRVWALHSEDGRCVNGKRTAAIHAIRADFTPAIDAVRLSSLKSDRTLPPCEFAFPADSASAADWFS